MHFMPVSWHYISGQFSIQAPRKPQKSAISLPQAPPKLLNFSQAAFGERRHGQRARPRGRLDEEERQEPLRLQGAREVDEGSEIIRTAILTAADLHDSQPAAHLIRGDEHAVYGDKAYASQGLRDRLADAGHQRRPDVQSGP